MMNFAGPSEDAGKLLRMNRVAALTITCAIALVLSACSVTPGGSSAPDAKIVEQFQSKDLSSHAVRSIRQVEVNNLAIMPIVAAVPFGGDPLASGAADTITADIYRQASGTWKLVPQGAVMQAAQQTQSGGNLDDAAIQVGKATGADAVLYGTVERYVERVGAEYSADKPASVAFSLKLLDMKSRQVVWNAKFSKTQQPLGTNFFNLPTFLENKGQWVLASELASDGVGQALENLRSSLGIAPIHPASSAEP
jgi:PBP1b-binding outer membrane lipoprotein LpoB